MSVRLGAGAPAGLVGRRAVASGKPSWRDTAMRGDAQRWISGPSRSALPPRDRRHTAPPSRSLSYLLAPRPLSILQAPRFGTSTRRGAATQAQQTQSQRSRDAAWEQQEWEIFRQWRARKDMLDGAKAGTQRSGDVVDLFGRPAVAGQGRAWQGQEGADWWNPRGESSGMAAHSPRPSPSPSSSTRTRLDERKDREFARKMDEELLARVRRVDASASAHPPGPDEAQNSSATTTGTAAQTYAALLAHPRLSSLVAHLTPAETQRIARFYLGMQAWSAVSALIGAAGARRLEMLGPLLEVDTARTKLREGNRRAYHQIMQDLLDRSTAGDLQAWSAAASEGKIIRLSRVMLDVDEQHRHRRIDCEGDKTGVISDAVLDRLQAAKQQDAATCTTVALRWIAYFWEMRDMACAERIRGVLATRAGDAEQAERLTTAASTSRVVHAATDLLSFARDHLPGQLAFEIMTDLQRVVSASAKEDAGALASWTEATNRLIEDWVIFDAIPNGANLFLRYLRTNLEVGPRPFALRTETIQAIYRQLDKVGIALGWKITRVMLQRGMPMPPGHTITPLIEHIEGLSYVGQRTILVEALQKRGSGLTAAEWSAILQEMIRNRWWSYIARVREAAMTSPVKRDVAADPALMLVLVEGLGRPNSTGSPPNSALAQQVIRDFAAASGPLEQLPAGHLSTLARAFVAVGADRAAMRVFGFMVDCKDPPAEDDVAMLVSTAMGINPVAGLRLLQRAMSKQVLRRPDAFHGILEVNERVEDATIKQEISDLCASTSVAKQLAVTRDQRMEAQQQALDRHLRAKEYTLALRVARQLFGDTSASRKGISFNRIIQRAETCLAELVNKDPEAVDWPKLSRAFTGWQNNEPNRIAVQRMARLRTRLRKAVERARASPAGQ